MALCSTKTALLFRLVDHVVLMLYKIQHTPVFPVSSKNYFFWARKPKGARPVKEGFVRSCPRSKQDLFIIYTSLKIFVSSANKRGSKYLIKTNFIIF